MTRVRENHFVSPYSVNTEWAGPIGGTTNYGSNSTPTLWIDEVCTDEVIPHFKARSANGEIFNNPYRKTKSQIQHTVGHLNRSASYLANGVPAGYAHGGSYVLSQMWGGGLNPFLVRCDLDEIDVQRLIDLSVTQAYANIELSRASILETLAESQKTVQLLAQTFNGAVKLFRAVNRLDLLRAKRNLKSLSRNSMEILRRMKSSGEYLANKYMEVRYGFRPLIYDCCQISQALSDKLTPKDRVTFRGYASKTSSGDAYWTHRIPQVKYQIGYGYMHMHQSLKREVSVSSGVLTSIKEVSQFNNWGTDKIVETMWELVPLSFVADWFFNIGQTIASFTPEAGVRILTSWSTVRDKTTLYTDVGSCYTTVYNPLQVRNLHFSVVGCASEKITSSVERIPYTKRSIIPSCKVNLDCLKLLDLAFIIKSLTKRSKR